MLEGNISKGALLASAPVSWLAMALVFLLPRPKSQGIFWVPHNKKYQNPEVALDDFSLDGRP